MPMPRMLEMLKSFADEIEMSNEWEADFISNLLIKFEQDAGYKLSAKQFEKLNQIHQKYVKGW